MPMMSELALLRANVKILQDLAYRLEASIDRVEQQHEDAHQAEVEDALPEAPF